jgi:hypothetical protein
LEHVLIEKVGQLFWNLLWGEGITGRRHEGINQIRCSTMSVLGSLAFGLYLSVLSYDLIKLSSERSS